MNAPVRLQVVAQSEGWDEAACQAMIERIEPCLAGQVQVASAATVALGGDALLQDLNSRFRGKNRPTNVLSFPDEDEEDGVRMLGDIVLSRETLFREADEAGVPFGHHFAHLVIHGFLHLVGYDHMLDDEAREMETLETRILAELSIADPHGGPAG